MKSVTTFSVSLMIACVVGIAPSADATYSVALGRWLQRDPIGYAGGSVNLYEYVKSNPLGFVDPLGLEPGGCNSGACDGRTDDVKFERCRRAVQLALKNCLKNADKPPSANSCSPPTKDQCWKDYDRRMEECRSGKIRVDTPFLGDSKYFDCFSRCVATGTKACLGVGGIGEGILQIPVPKTVNPPVGVGSERLISNIVGRLATSQRLTAALQVARTPGIMGAVLAGDCVAAVEVGCAVYCAGGP